MLSTMFTQRYGIRHPLVQAPMAGVAGGALAGAVSAAGGLGMLGVGSATTLEWIAAQAALARPHGSFGIGLMTWAVDKRPELLDGALAERPLAIVLSFGDPAQYVERVHAAGIAVFSQVQDLATARQALAAGADVLIAQGTDAGGHTGAVGTLPLLQLVLDLGDEAGVPVLAAGGIATGRGVAGVLAMGAAGGWIGTRFAATREAMGTDAAKQAILRAEETQTLHTHVFDIVQKIPWPDPFPGRALTNAFARRWHGHEEELKAHLESILPECELARSREADVDMSVDAGRAVVLIADLPPAAALVERLMRDAETTLRQVGSLLSDGAGAEGTPA
ncbi:MAG: NAD(P)H-dependent flavin oxidoreductase [Dehalococcoidia bacterium]